MQSEVSVICPEQRLQFVDTQNRKKLPETDGTKRSTFPLGLWMKIAVNCISRSEAGLKREISLMMNYIIGGKP